MPVVPFRLFLLFVAAMTTATAVCVSGNIGFVGLVVPHMMRMLIGPDHRVLLPASALAGAIFLVLCDTLGRLVMPPAEVRVGIMTAILGTPYFLYLLRRIKNPG
jgi:iron complex transport system permease protein